MRVSKWIERAHPSPTRSTVANILALAEFGGAGVKEVRGRAVKGLRGGVVVHEVEGLAYLHRSPTGRTIARMCGGSGTSRSH